MRATAVIPAQPFGRHSKPKNSAAIKYQGQPTVQSAISNAAFGKLADRVLGWVQVFEALIGGDSALGGLHQVEVFLG